MARFTLDEIATLDADAALRKEFDGRNAVVARVIARIFIVISFFEIVAWISDETPWKVGVAAFNLAAVILFSRLLRRVIATDRAALRTHFPWLDAAERFIARYSRAAVLTYILGQYFVLMVLSVDSKADAPWMMLYPYVTNALRLLPAEYLFVHATIFTTSLLQTFVSGSGNGVLIAAAANNLLALGISLFVTRRVRRSFTADWVRSREKAREEVRLRDELRFAREVQVSMLPQEVPSLGWIDIAGLSLPATEVGGDYYDFYVLDGERLAIAAADVAGHGLASGMVLSGIRSCLRLLSDEMSHPERVMARMHSMVSQTTRHRMLVTLSITLFDRNARRAYITSAAHPPVMLRRAADETVVPIEIRSLPLGARLPQTFSKCNVAFAPGDVFLLHTDGIYETFDASGNPYGLDRLAETLRREGARQSSQEILEAIVSDLNQFRGSVTQEDDVTLVVAKIAG